MAYDIQLKSDPSPLPIKPAVLILIHKRKKKVYVAYTTNARGRAAVLASMIRHRAVTERQHLRDLPEGDVKDFVVLASRIDLAPRDADRAVRRIQNGLLRDGYTLFGGPRSALPLVVLNGRRMSITQAMAEAKTKAGYQTVYRRIKRGWPVRQALDLD